MELSKEDKIKNSKLISDFLELRTVDKRKRIDQIYYVPFSKEMEIEYDYHSQYLVSLTEFRCSDMLFDSDWNWIMEVVEKIEELDLGKYYDDCYSYLFTINRNHSLVEKIGDNNRPPFIQVIVDKENQLKRKDTARTSLEATYFAVVDFIKWYNEK